MPRLRHRLTQWALAVGLGILAGCDADSPVDRNFDSGAGADFVPPTEAGADTADAGADGDS
jgi:hypothetical protein